jgi:hypothetical protein
MHDPRRGIGFELHKIACNSEQQLRLELVIQGAHSLVVDRVLLTPPFAAFPVQLCLHWNTQELCGTMLFYNGRQPMLHPFIGPLWDPCGYLRLDSLE